MPTLTIAPYTPETAERIAFYGALKMEKQGYTWRKNAQSDSPDTFIVTKPDGDQYHLVLSDGGHDSELQSCTCAFSNNGLNQHTCKHCAFVLNAIREEAERDAQAADDFSEYDNFGHHDLVMGKF